MFWLLVLFFKRITLSFDFYSFWTFCLLTSWRMPPPRPSVCMCKRREDGITDVLCKEFKVVYILKECNWKKKKHYCFFDSVVLTFGQNFLFHPQIRYLRQSAHNGKLLKHQKCRRTKSELISVKMETQVQRKSLEIKNPGRSRQSAERCLTGLLIPWTRTRDKHEAPGN